MAQTTRNVTFSKQGFVEAAYPNNHTTINSGTFYNLYYENATPSRNRWLFALSAWPTSLKHNKLYGVQFLMQLNVGAGGYGDYTLYPCTGDFNASTITYNTAPSMSLRDLGYKVEFNSPASAVTNNFLFPSNMSDSSAEDAYLALTRPSFAVIAQMLYTDPKIKSVLLNGSTPYAIVSYDNSVKVKSQVYRDSGASGTTVSSATAQTFSWQYLKAPNEGYCAYPTWSQGSAIFYWKKSTESSYRSVSISGTTLSVTIPANTFPSGSTIQWYVKGTDEDGTTTQTSVYSFDTATTQITPDTYPSGNSIDNRGARSFSWHFASSYGNLQQQSASLHWRVQGASSWNIISASGATQSLSVAAYTFPSGSTIEWFLSGTDVGGYASMTSTQTFGTLAFTLTVTNAPTGSNQDTRLPKTFAWTLRNTQGDATQSSSNLYWRVSGASNYTKITNATATKSITVPANTFPTGSTIQWYVDATAADGTIKTTSATTFSTVSPKIEATQYPSGSNVFSGEPITFKWHFTSAVGDYNQSSAVFYWRSSTSDPYTSVSISGNTQQVTIPANTFPTNSTIYWYLSGTASGGNTTTTSVTNFKTQTTQITPQNSPTSGYANPRNAITFSWYFAASGGSIPQQSATFYWRESGASSYTSVTASGNSVTILANTFPIASTVQWYISGTDIGGTSSTSTVYSFSTTASTAIARAKSPINSGVDGSVPITFVWTLSSADGFPASRVILEWKLPLEDDQHWHTIVDANEAITQYTVDADTFSSGEINWRVRAYNVDAVEGPESTASFICMVAPIVTALAASPVPFSVITWQANDQEAFQLEVDGKLYGTYFGQEKEFVMPDYFRDGIHEVKVRVLGKVELWSEWVTTTVSIQNTPGADVELEAYADVDVELKWETSNTEADFLIYRDGVLIGHTANLRFVDRLSLGRHNYTVVNRLSDGNYSISETVSRRTCVEYLHLESTDGTEAANVRRGLKGKADPEHQGSRDVTFNKLDGHEYPALVTSNFMNHSIGLSAVFFYTEEKEHEKFQRLLGKAVIVKINDGTCCAAIIDSWNRTPRKTYYTAYEFTIRQIDWEDYDDTQ